jgi:hypothetical protein
MATRVKSVGEEAGGGTRLRARRFLGHRAGLAALLALSCLPCRADQEPARAVPAQVEAAFLRNFARYVTWPAQAFADDRAPWRICILGRDPFGEALEKAVTGRTEKGRGFEVSRADALAGLAPCQIVFVAFKDRSERCAALAELKNRPVLTVGDAPEFLQEGGVIRFQVSDYVEISVNLDQARAASLVVQTKLLEVTQEVLENGALRRRR